MVFRFKYLFYTILVFFFHFFGIIIFFEDKNLGDGYLLWADTAPSIAYKYRKGEGAYEVVPPKVNMLNYNSKFIIAMTIDIKDKKKKFWIINKNNGEQVEDSLTSYFNKETNSSLESILYSQRVGPMDSLSFIEYINQNDINLVLDSVKHPIFPF